jgi:hypothetical protein
MEITLEELALLREIFDDLCVQSMIDYENEECVYHALYEKIMG